MHVLASLDWLYGKGVFTTIPVYDKQPFLWEKHWHRLTKNAAKLGIDLSEFTEESVAESLADALKENGLRTGRARITFVDESPSEIWSDGGEKKTGLSIITASSRTIPDHFKLSVSPYRINTASPLTGLKSCNYLEHLMAYDEAKNRGFDEGIRLNERGEIASACMANIFWLKGERLYTPSLKTGSLAGTTREFILENLESVEVEVGVEMLIEADMIFLTSAGIGTIRVGEFDGKSFEAADHPILELLPKQAEPPA